MPSSYRSTPLLAITAAIAISTSATAAKPAPVWVGFDGEFGHSSSTSAEAIRRGATIAIEEINARGGVLGGRPLQLVTTDNRSVPARGVDNIKELAARKDLVAVLTGKFSPVVVETVPHANRLGLPLLAAWSAADEIVDHDHSPSYVFRLSLRDTWAVEAMMKNAQQRGLRKVGLLVPNTAWGRSSLRAAQAFEDTQRGARLVAHEWYNWGDASLLPGYRRLQAAGAEVLLFVANDKEGVVLANELAALPRPERLPILSHWGITGGRFFEAAGKAVRQMDLRVVQTFSFIENPRAQVAPVLAAYQRQFGVSDPRKIESPVGVAHAYDLVHLLARAIDKAGGTNRAAVRDALEHLGPYQGLVRDYPEPFTRKRHEALGLEDVFLASYAADGAIVRLPAP